MTPHPIGEAALLVVSPRPTMQRTGRSSAAACRWCALCAWWDDEPAPRAANLRAWCAPLRGKPEAPREAAQSEPEMPANLCEPALRCRHRRRQCWHCQGPALHAENLICELGDWTASPRPVQTWVNSPVNEDLRHWHQHAATSHDPNAPNRSIAVQVLPNTRQQHLLTLQVRRPPQHHLPDASSA